jgi:hypothetical protein
MAEAEFDRTQKLTQQNKLIVNDAELKADNVMQCMSNSERLAGDLGSEPVSADDLQVEDLTGPTIGEGIDTPLESAKVDADGPKASSQMQKKITTSSAAGKANGATSSPTVKKVCWNEFWFLTFCDVCFIGPKLRHVWCGFCEAIRS